MSSHASNHHILSLKVYFGVATALLVLTIVTVVVAQFQFGEFNLLFAMVIAALKASLVALFFMHLKYDSKIYMVVFIGSLMFLAVFVIFTMFDTLRRGDIYDEVAHPIKNARIYDQPAAVTDSAHIYSDTRHSPKQPAEDVH